MTTRAKLPGSSPHRRDRLLRERVHDTYKMRSKLREPTACGDCGAVFHRGRWQWIERPSGAAAVLCPACQRIRDRCPAGYLTLAGSFFRQHRDEILRLAHNTASRERNEHPLRRMMAIDKQQGQDHSSTLITTTDMGLARDIGEAVHHAYKGELDYQYTDEANILEVKWCR